MVYPSLLSLIHTPRLPDWTDAPADLNGLFRFAERRNLVSACVPSHFNWTLPPSEQMYAKSREQFRKVATKLLGFKGAGNRNCRNAPVSFLHVCLSIHQAVLMSELENRLRITMKIYNGHKWRGYMGNSRQDLLSCSAYLLTYSTEQSPSWEANQ